MKSAWKFLSGSLITYVVMAACANAPRSHTTASSAGRNAGGSSNPVADNGGTLGATEAGAPESGGAQSAGDTAVSVGGMMATVVDPVPDAAAEPAMDGSRLKAVYMVGADGSKQWNYLWWDSERKEECSFASFSDGTNRCVPTASVYAASIFSDASCSTPYFMSPTSQCTTVKYGFITAAAPNCTGSYESINTLTSTTPTSLFTGTPAKCTDASTSLSTYLTTYTFYTGKAVPLTSFVSATKQHG